MVTRCLQVTAVRVPPFLGWLQDWWTDREGTGRRSLREPEQILRARQVVNLKGEWRRLVEGTEG